MKEEYKRRAENYIEMIHLRVKMVDEMLHGQRPAHQEDAKKFINEVKQGLEAVREIISIS